MLKQIKSVTLDHDNKGKQACSNNQQIESLPSDVVLVAECLELVADSKLKFMLSLCLQSYIHNEKVN